MARAHSAAISQTSTVIRASRGPPRGAVSRERAPGGSRPRIRRGTRSPGGLVTGARVGARSYGRSAALWVVGRHAEPERQLHA